MENSVSLDEFRASSSKIVDSPSDDKISNEKRGQTKQPKQKKSISLQEFLRKPEDPSSIVSEPVVVTPTIKEVKKRCENWQPIQDAVRNSGVDKFLELTKNVLVTATETKYSNGKKTEKSWDDNEQVVKCASIAIENDAGIMLQHLSQLSHKILVGKAFPRLLGNAFQLYFSQGIGHNAIEFFLPKCTEKPREADQFWVNIIDRDDERMLQIAMCKARNGYHVFNDHYISKTILYSKKMTILGYAAFLGRINIVDTLIDKYNINPTEFGYGYFGGEELCLHTAAQGGQLEMVKYLIDVRKMDFSIKSKTEKTPLDYATNEKVIEYLKEKEETSEKMRTRWNPNTQSFEPIDFKTKAVLRLLSDYKDLLKNPLQTIQAAPLENNIFEWHVILSPPKHKGEQRYSFAGIKFHLIMTFPENYPRAPPRIQLSTYMEHPNVFKDYQRGNGAFSYYICLDILNERSYSSTVGWTPAYSVMSILMQLQTFLFDESNTAKHGGNGRFKTFRAANEFKCTNCGYNVDFKSHNLSQDEINLYYGIVKEKDHQFEISEHISDTVATKTKAKKKQSHTSPKKPDIAEPSQPKDLSKELDEPQDKANPNTSIKGPTISDQMENHSAAVTIALKRIKQPFSYPGMPRYYGPALLPTLPGDTLVQIFDYLPTIEDISALLRTCTAIRDVGRKYCIWIRRDLYCFYNKKTFHEDVLGIGLFVERHKGSNKLKTLNSPLDLISRTAFIEDELRVSSMNEPIHYWIPIPLNEIHSKRSMPLLKSIIVAIVTNVSFVPKTPYTATKKGPNMFEVKEFEDFFESLRPQFDPFMILDVIPRLMNHMVVSLMNTQGSSDLLPLHASEKALLGYCTYHHILLNLIAEFPQLQQHIDYKLEKFIEHDSARVKLISPDLGELLVYLSVSSHITWEQIATTFLQEFFDRTVMWTLDYRHGNHGELAYLENSNVSEYRLDTTLETTRVSCRLLMFQVFFLRNVGKPKGSTLSSVLNDYNNSYGHPPLGIAEKLVRECKKIIKVNSWSKFYERIGIPSPTPEEMTKLLRESVVRSEHKGYHICRTSQQELYQLRVKKDVNVGPFVQVEDSSKQTNGHNKTVRVNIKNLSYRVTCEDLEREFQQFSSFISKVVVPLDEQGRGRGFAFIIFNDEKCAENVIQFLQNMPIDRRPIKLYEQTNRSQPVYFDPAPNTV